MQCVMQAVLLQTENDNKGYCAVCDAGSLLELEDDNMGSYTVCDKTEKVNKAF